ncbi:hypothetical protein SUGI_0385150 [Cryptomeria japonica]|nr:hypothetical protein SUGI_0385150 [Cryptomeria japonica]
MVVASLPKTIIPRDWVCKLHLLKEVIIADDDKIMPILRLSYFSLPARLKACSTYLSFFPKVEQINCVSTISLDRGGIYFNRRGPVGGCLGLYKSAYQYLSASTMGTL